MFSQDFVLSVLQNDRVIREEKGAVVKVAFDSDYVIRIRNKHRLSCAVDVYVDGERVNETGQIVVFGNDYVDLQGFIKSKNDGRKFKFARITDSGVKQPGESQNGVIEARFYLQKGRQDAVDHHHYYHDLVYRPIYIYRDYVRPWWPWNPPYPPYQPAWYGSNDNITCSYSAGGGTQSANIGSVSSPGVEKVDFKLGATVEGEKFTPPQEVKIDFDLQEQVTVLKLALEGYEVAAKICTGCGKTYKDEVKFCSNCGNKMGGENVQTS